MVFLNAQNASDSTFAGFSTAPPYFCGGVVGGPGGNRKECQIFLDDSVGDSASVEATFNLAVPCVAPGVKRETLANAKRSIKRHRCSVGQITYAFSHKVKKGRVISQNPLAGWRREHGSKINLVVSKGARP